MRHTKQALPLRSMSKSDSSANKTETFRYSRLRLVWRACLTLLGAIAISCPVGSAQQSTAIEPCRETKPCENKPPPASAPAHPKRRSSTAANAKRKHKTPAVPQTEPRTRASEKLIDANIPDDPAVEKMLGPYSGKVRALQVVIGRLDGDLKKEGVGGGTLGNFVADGIRVQSSVKLGKPVVLAITNSGGLRKSSIAAGELLAQDIFELLPFENGLVEIDLTGEQLLKLLAVVVAGKDTQSGAMITYRLDSKNKPELISARLLDSRGSEMAIDPKTTYTVVTIDYLLKLASGSYSILQEGKNATPLGVTLRDAIMDYVKAESAAGRSIKATLDSRYISVGPGESGPEGRPR